MLGSSSGGAGGRVATMGDISTPTYPNRVGILDGVWGVTGSDMVDLDFANFSLILASIPFLKNTIKCLQYI